MSLLGTRSLTLMVGGEEYTAEVSDVRITSGESDSDFVTFADAAEGGARTYRLAMTMGQDPETGSLWDKIWTAAGTSIAAIIAPAGGVTPGATTPHFSGNVIISEPDGDLLGGEANASPTARFTTEVEWEYTQKPTRLVA